MQAFSLLLGLAVLPAFFTSSAESDEPSRPVFRATFLDGEMEKGHLVALDAENFSLEADGAEETFSMERLMQLRPTSPPEEMPAEEDGKRLEVTLIDGSRMVAREVTTDESGAEVVMTDDRKRDMATDQIRSIRFRLEEESPIAWNEILDRNHPGDLLVVGELPSLDYHEGILGKMTPKTVEFRIEEETLPVPREKLFGVVFFQSDDEKLPSTVAKLIDIAGNRLMLQSVFLEDQSLRWKTPCGLSGTTPLEEVRRLDFSQGKMIFLSRIVPTDYRWTPFFTFRRDHAPAERVRDRLSEFFGPNFDAGWPEGRLMLDGEVYEKGLALQSRTELRYDLEGKYRRLEALVGIDDRIRPLGNVKLTIRGDGNVLLEETFAGTEPARAVDLDLEGVDRLEILVDFGRDMGKGDHLILANARLME